MGGNRITKVLIANRGEIALRVMRSCRLMGIQSVAIYSSSELGMPHTTYADQSFDLGEGDLHATYLNQEKIVAIAKESGADAIHPGYGFLSENSKFAKLIEKSGLIFIGPTADVIDLMGDKQASKIRMEEIGVPIIPGYHGDDQSLAKLKGEAERIGVPVLIKASAGGGGKGMRVVDDLSSFEEHLASAQREATSAFANDKMLIEKYIVNPRHIEVQVFSDMAGNHRHFFERECTIQRRHQKIVEESPSVALTSETKKSILDSAVSICENIGYRGAGTVEYILDDDQSFYFLEMNTRLQVEHPVTEMVTGFDLVELQLKVAQGEQFTFSQSEVMQEGHSIEVRLYAEDPDNNFLPSIGRIDKIGETSLSGVRFDSGYSDGDEITINFDPMLAKLIVDGKDRSEAVAKMLHSLDELSFLGVKTNREYLKRILRHPNFLSGEFYTHFVTTFEEDLKPQAFDESVVAQAIAAHLVAGQGAGPNHLASGDMVTATSWDSLTNFRNV
jgi:acetyl/propionyl-CoA carboxylase alpha subunit